MRPARSAKSIAVSAAETVKRVQVLVVQRETVSDDLAVALASGVIAVAESLGASPSPGAIRAAAAAASGGVVAAVAEADLVPAMVLTVCRYALGGEGVHVVTTGDRRTAALAEPVRAVAAALSVGVGVLTPEVAGPQRREAYLAPITIGSFLEFGSDYLRDNLRGHPSEMLRRQAAAAVVEDAEAILAAGAMTPIYLTDDRPVQPIDSAAADVALCLRADADYGVRHGRVLFSTAALAAIRLKVEWTGAATVAAVDAAKEVERALLLRESLLPVRGLDAMTEVTIQGYLRLYGSLSGFCSSGFTGHDLLSQLYGVTTLSRRRPRLLGRPDSWPSRGIIAMERVVDGQRAAFYRLRAMVDAEPVSIDTLPRLRELAVARIRQRILDRRWREHLARLRFLMLHSKVLYAAARDWTKAFAADAEALYGQALQGVDEEAAGVARDIMRKL